MMLCCCSSTPPAAPPSVSNNSSDNRRSRKRSKFCCGLFLLLLVDVIWVASSEASRYLFVNINYNKPYMSTYIKTCMFSIYLVGFIFYPPWRRKCIRCVCDDYPGQYQLVGETDTDTDGDNEENYQIRNSMSEPFYLPAKIPSDTSDAENVSNKNEAENDVVVEDPKQSSTKVKFNDVMEVCQLEDSKEMHIARMNFGAAVRAKLLLRHEQGILSVPQVMRVSFLFAFLFFLGNLLYQESLGMTEVAIVNIMSSMSTFFTLILAGLCPTNANDKFTLTKLILCIFSVLGMAIVALGSVDDTNPLVIIDKLKNIDGMIMALLSAFCYALYLVLFRKSVGSEDNISIPMFFGFVGMFTVVLLWPGMLALHYANFEKFQLPDRTEIIFLVANSLLGTVLSELLWLWGCLLTSSLLGTLSLSLTIPMSIACDMIFRQVPYNWKFLLGAIPPFLSIFVLALLGDDDPAFKLIKKICRCFTSCCSSSEDSSSPTRIRSRRRIPVDDEQDIPLTSLEDESDS